MKKLRIIVLMIILAFSFSVQAKVLLKINCDSNTISDNQKVNCVGKLTYDQEGINDIEFDYKTNLDISFLTINNFTVSNLDNKVLIHSEKTLFDIIPNSTKIMEFTLSKEDNLNSIEDFIITNIKINKIDDIIIDDVIMKFNITKNNILDNTCILNSISIDNEEIKEFDSEKLEYYLNVEKEIIFIDGIRTSNRSSVTGLGNVHIPSGETIERDIRVVAEDKTEKTYKLFITNTKVKEKEEVKEEIIKSSDNTLKRLELYSDTKIDFNYNNNIEIYNIDLKNIDSFTIIGELNDNKASFVKGYGPRKVKLNKGYNKVLIKVLSESNIERVITLNINYYDDLYDNNELSLLKINDREIDLNDENIEIIFPNDISRIEISAVPKSKKAIVKYQNTDLLVGNNNITIEVVSESGIGKIYNVNVIREAKEIVLADTNNNKITNIKEDSKINKVNCYSIILIGITVLIIPIIYLIKKKKTLYCEII